MYLLSSKSFLVLIYPSLLETLIQDGDNCLCGYPVTMTTYSETFLSPFDWCCYLILNSHTIVFWFVYSIPFIYLLLGQYFTLDITPIKWPINK